MEQLIQSSDELIEYFQMTYKRLSCRVSKRSESMLKGIYVNAKIRKEVLTSVDQGKYVQDGEFFKVEFKNEGGGVYRAFVELGGNVLKRES